MDVEHVAQEVSMAGWLLRIGTQHGLPIVSLGTVLIVIATVVTFKKNRGGLRATAYLSLLPGLIGLVVILRSMDHWIKLATSPNAPKPAEFAEAVSMAFAGGLYGILMTIVPITICLIGLSNVSADHRSEELPE